MKLLVLAFLACLAQDGKPPAQTPLTEQERAVSDEEIDETIAMVRDALDLCREAEVNRDLDEARLHLEGALEVMQALDGLRDPKLLGSLEAISVRARELGLLRAQVATREWTVGIHERLLAPDHTDLLLAKHNLAVARSEARDLRGALELQEHVHTAWERLLPRDHPGLLAAKQNLAITLRELGFLESAHELQEYVHAARERVLPKDHPDLLEAKLNLAGTLSKLGDVERARELEEYVHAARERLLPKDHPNLLRAKQNLAITRAHFGDLKGALELEEYLHAAWERLLPKDHPDLLIAKLNLAVTRSRLGDLEGARELEEYVHAARARLLPKDHPDLLAAKQNLAGTRRELRDLEGARELFEYVHAARERLLPTDHPDLLAAKHNLAAMRNELGDFEGALELGRYVYAVRERLLPKDHRDLLAVKVNLAISCRGLGDLEGALELDKYVHAALERLLPRDHVALLRARANLAGTRSLLGDFEGACEFQEYVNVAWERILPKDHPDLLTAKHNLAGMRYKLGDLAGACEITRSLLASQLARVAALRSESPRVARAGALVEVLRLFDALLLSESVPAAEYPLDATIFSVLESLRLVSTSSSEVASALSRFPELDVLHGRLANVRGDLNDLSLSSPAEAEALETWRKRLVELADDRDRLERELRSELAKKGVFYEIPSSELVGGALDEDSVSISFLRYWRGQPRDPGSIETPPSVDSLLAFVVTPDGAVRRVELGLSEEIEELVTAWRASLGKPLGLAKSGRGIGVTAASTKVEDEWAVGQRLREKLIDPCLGGFGDERPSSAHLILDDFLYLIPVDALPWKDGKRLGEVLSVHIETSTQRLIAPPRPAPVGGILLAIGGVDFDATGVEAPTAPVFVATPPTRTSQDRSSARSHFDPLPQTALEVEALAGLYELHVADDPVVRVGQRGSKKALHELAPNARYLHIATHGWFAPETFTSMIDSAEAIAKRDMFSRAENTIRGFAPDTLCGLALAGANHGVNSLGKVPGIITAEELATLDLRNCELAVLSACETNVGLRRAGQGIQSLQSALHAAGARTAITSLWKVDDDATRRLMELFYTKLWREKLGKAEALWQAKMALRAERHPVRAWAAWVLSGDPR